MSNKTKALVNEAATLIRTDRNLSKLAFALMQKTIAFHFESGMSPHAVNAVVHVLEQAPRIHTAALYMVKDNTALTYNAKDKTFTMTKATGTAKQIARAANDRLQAMPVISIFDYAKAGDQNLSVLVNLRNERNALSDKRTKLLAYQTNNEAALVQLQTQAANARQTWKDAESIVDAKDIKALNNVKLLEGEYIKLKSLVLKAEKQLHASKDGIVSLDGQLMKLRERIHEAYAATKKVETTLTKEQKIADLQKKQDRAMQALSKAQNSLNDELATQGKGDQISKGIGDMIKDSEKLDEAQTALAAAKAQLTAKSAEIERQTAEREELEAKAAALQTALTAQQKDAETEAEKMLRLAALLEAITKIANEDGKTKTAKKIIELLKQA